MRALFPGRFQPFSLKHVALVQNIVINCPHLALTIGVADWKGEPNKDNFLTGREAAEIARLSLQDAGLTQVCVRTIPLGPTYSLEQSLRNFFGDELPDVLFSGSDKTLAAARKVAEGHDLVIIDTQDDDTSPPRSREIRMEIERGVSNWQTMVSPGAAKFLQQRKFKDRLEMLGEGIKRPWSEKR